MAPPQFSDHAPPERPSHLSYGVFLPAVLAVLAVIAVFVLADIQRGRQMRDAERARVSEELATLTSRIETNINGNVQLVQGFVAAVATEPDMSQARFSSLAEQLFRAPSQLRNIAGAPDMVIRYVYPEAQNQKSLGLDYRSNPKQRDGVMRARNSHNLVLTGPVDLIQGGTGLIARFPVYVSVGKGQTFWGIVSAVVDLDKLYNDSGLGRSNLDIAINLASGSDNSRKVFYGRPDIFNDNPVEASLNLGYDTWQFAVAPKGGWEAGADMTVFRLSGGAVSLCVIAPLIWAGFLMRARQKTIFQLQGREDELETISQRLELALDASRIGVWEFEPATGKFIWDRQMRALYSIPPDKEDCGYEDWTTAVHPDDVADAEKAFGEAVRNESPYLTQFRVVSPSGEVRFIRAHGSTHRMSSGRIKIVGANLDVTADTLMRVQLNEARDEAERKNEELEKARLKLEHQSLHDALTNLPNRRYIDQMIADRAANGGGDRLAFIHIDLDRFKEVNDTLGHAAGDEVLRMATARLRAILGPEELAARIGGDEFVVTTQGAEPRQRAEEIAEKIVAALSMPIEIHGQETRIGASVGIAWQNNVGDDLNQLLINADISLYEAKKRGRGRVEVFSDELRAEALRSKQTADDVLLALDRDQFVPFFQPQFDAHSFEIVGVEALARWDHPERGMLTPDRFLSVAEALNRVADIDSRILEKAMFQASRWAAEGIDVPKVSVNISAQRLKDRTLLEKIRNIPFRTGALSFELLESISFDGQDSGLAATIKDIKALGIDIEIDDFGTGHASIVSLLELAPKRLKIDRKLVLPITTSPSQRRLVSSIIEIGRSQNIEIVAEGVETYEHAEILRDLGCHILQGYAFAKPMSAAAFSEFARQARPVPAVHRVKSA